METCNRENKFEYISDNVIRLNLRILILKNKFAFQQMANNKKFIAQFIPKKEKKEKTYNLLSESIQHN